MKKILIWSILLLWLGVIALSCSSYYKSEYSTRNKIQSNLEDLGKLTITFNDSKFQDTSILAIRFLLSKDLPIERKVTKWRSLSPLPLILPFTEKFMGFENPKEYKFYTLENSESIQIDLEEGEYYGLLENTKNFLVEPFMFRRVGDSNKTLFVSFGNDFTKKELSELSHNKCENEFNIYKSYQVEGDYQFLVNRTNCAKIIIKKNQKTTINLSAKSLATNSLISFLSFFPGIIFLAPWSNSFGYDDYREIKTELINP
ncbi:MAG: hypothetical protein SFU98_17125 [Leptospiraceae bacterium]|nr:hypothetical protein [Leptospiraceae bacterium]